MTCDGPTYVISAEAKVIGDAIIDRQNITFECGHTIMIHSQYSLAIAGVALLEETEAVLKVSFV